jgi:hypothetical protein
LQDLVDGEISSILASLLGFLPSLDYFVRPRQHICRNRKTDLLRRLEIYHQLELRRCSRTVFWTIGYGITLTILSPRLFSAVIWIGVIRNSSASSRAATVSCTLANRTWRLGRSLLAISHNFDTVYLSGSFRRFHFHGSKPQTPR